MDQSSEGVGDCVHEKYFAGVRVWWCEKWKRKGV